MLSPAAKNGCCNLAGHGISRINFQRLPGQFGCFRGVTLFFQDFGKIDQGGQVVLFFPQYLSVITRGEGVVICCMTGRTGQ